MSIGNIHTEDGTIHSTPKIVDELLNKVVAYSSFSRSYDSGVDFSEVIELTESETEQLRTSFNRNYGTTHDGKKHYLTQEFTNNEYYFRFTTRLSLVRQHGVVRKGNFDYFKFYKMINLSKDEFGSFNIYINNLKIPDNEIAVYISEAHTDILIPQKYINYGYTGDNKIFIEKKIYPKYQYVTDFTPDFSNTVYHLNLTQQEFNNCKFDIKNCLVFNNGILLNNIINNIQTYPTANRVSITFNQNVNGNIEIIFDSTIKLNENIFSGIIRKAPFYLTENYLKLINGPISKHSCYFFINGKRIYNNEIYQKSRFNFEYDNKTPVSTNATIIYTDQENINEFPLKIYGDDYYLENMVGIKKVCKGVNNQPTNTQFDSIIGFNYNDILNLNGSRYTQNYANSVIDNLKKIPNTDEKTKNLITNKPYLLRDFLNHFGKNELYKVINVPSIDMPENYTLSFETNKRETGSDKFFYLVNVNGNHIPDSELIIDDYFVHDVIKIPIKFFSVGINYVHIEEIRVIKENTVEFEIYRPNQVSFDGQYSTMTIPTLKTVINPEDYLLLLQKNGDINYYYSNKYDNIELSGKKGYIIKPGVTFSIDRTNNTTTIIWEGEPPTEDFIIYSRRFTYKHTYVLDHNINDINDIAIPLHELSQTRNIPIIPLDKGCYKVFLNGRRLLEGADFFIKYPGNYEKITYTLFSIMTKIQKNDVITIYFTGTDNKVLFSKPELIYNKYGLIYFKNLPIPYSPKYVNLYINGKLIFEKDIDILSDKLVRVPYVEYPMYDIYAETAFNIDLKWAQYFIEDYHKSTFETIIENWFKSFDFSTNVSIGTNDTAFNIYNTFDDTVDQVGTYFDTEQNKTLHVPNPYSDANAHKDIERANLYANAYVLWLINSGKTKQITKSDEDIKTNILKYFEIYNFSVNDIERADVVLTANTKIIDYVIGKHDKYLRDKYRKRRIIGKYGKITEIGSNELFNAWRDTYKDCANKIYPRDLPKVFGANIKTGTNQDIILGGIRGSLYSTETTNA
jgi:hypothetical protein